MACSRWHPSSEFAKSLIKRGRPLCKACLREQKAALMARKRKEPTQLLLVKQCSHCKRVKGYDEFWKHGAFNGGLQYRCKECHGKR